MKQAPSASSPAVRWRYAILAIVLGVALVGALYIKNRPHPAPHAAANTLSVQQAWKNVTALPELKAWAHFIEQRSGGKAHGAVMAVGSAPQIVNGVPCWLFDFIESGPQSTHRWESFAVSTTTGEVLVDDLDQDQVLTLGQWRAQRQPLERIKD
jgi:hypothetical protein